MYTRFGGWIVDGFPVIRDQWSTMIDNQLLPDFVISLEEEASQGDLLLRRFTQQHGLPDPSLYKAPIQSEGALNGASAAEGNQQPAVEEKVPLLLWYKTHLHMCILFTCYTNILAICTNSKRSRGVEKAEGRIRSPMGPSLLFNERVCNRPFYSKMQW